MSDGDFHLLSTLRRDPRYLSLPWNRAVNGGSPTPYLLLSYHRDRLLKAAQVHGWTLPHDIAVPALENLCDAALYANSGSDNLGSQRCFRIRILLSHVGALSVTADPIPPLPMSDPTLASLWLPSTNNPDPPSLGSPLLDIFLDTVPTPSGVFTRTKTTSREHYTAARERFAIPAPPTSSPLDVVLYNEEDDITETSIRNIAFLRRSPQKWVTPATTTGCLSGVIRRWLLEQGRIEEGCIGELRKNNIVDGEIVLTFNGVEGCRFGRIVMQ